MFNNRDFVIKQKLSGFTFVELMISIMLTMFVLRIVFDLYLTQMRNDYFQMQLLHTQDKARRAIAILKMDLQLAGYIGCGRLTADFPIASSLAETLTSQNRLSGTDAEIKVRHQSLVHAVLLAANQDATSLTVSKQVHFKAGDTLMISNCQHADIFTVKEVEILLGKQLLHTYYPLRYHYDRLAEIGHFAINTYYVAKTGRFHPDGSAITSLFIKNEKENPSELVADIASLSIHYSLNQGNKLMDVPARAITDWSAVKGIAVDFKIASQIKKNNWHFYTSLNS